MSKCQLLENNEGKCLWSTTAGLGQDRSNGWGRTSTGVRPADLFLLAV